MNANIQPGGDAPAAELRHALLELHKAMLDAQRIRYERVHGRIETSGELLGRVLHHPEFEWIRALSALIAQLDAWADAPQREGGELQEIVAAVRALVQPGSGIESFTPRYWQMVQDDPQVTMAHVKLTRLLK